MAQKVKNSLAMQATQVQPLGQEDPLEKGMATHSNLLDRTISFPKMAFQTFYTFGVSP